MAPSGSKTESKSERKSGGRREYAPRMSVEDRREQLLDAAISIIVRDGYGAISIDAIANEAGVTRPVVYRVFDGLGPLLGALLDRQEGRALTQLATAMPSQLDSGDPRSQIGAAIRELVAIVQGDPLTWRPVLFARDDGPEAVRERIDRDRELVRSGLADFLELALGGRGTPALDSEFLSHVLLASLEHFGRLILDDPDRFGIERIVDAVLGLFDAVSG